MKEYENIKALKTAIEKGEVKEDNLQIILDNDMVSFLIKDGTEEINVQTASGYDDIQELYEIVFPKASIDWC